MGIMNNMILKLHLANLDYNLMKYFILDLLLKLYNER